MLMKEVLKGGNYKLLSTNLFNIFYRKMSCTSADLDKCHEVACDLIRKAGEIITSRNDSRKSVVEKQSDIDLVTESDKEVENLLVQGISKEFPTHKFIGEEESSETGKPAQLTDDPTWIIDPIDGTMNFVHGFPHSCISVGLMVNRCTELAYVYNPVLSQSFYARRGQGAFYNEKKIQVSGQKELSKALLMLEYGTSRNPDKMKVIFENMQKLVPIVHGVRSLGSSALNMSMVALGVADAYYEFGTHAWDVCAGDLIVREAGGVVLDPSGDTFDLMSRRVMAAASPELVTALSKIITQYHPQPRDD